MSAARRTTLVLAGRAGLCALAAYSLACCLADRFWAAELAASFRWQVGWAGLLPLGLLSVSRRRVEAACAAALALAHLAPGLALTLTRPERVALGPGLRVATSNLLWRTGDGTALARWLEDERVDVVALQELDRDRLPWLDALRARFPHQLRWPAADGEWQRGTWGLALLSRHPIRAARAHHAGWIGPPLLEARIAWSGAELLFVVAHPMRPGRAWRIAARDAALAAAARLARESPRAIVLGDLNATLYSGAFADLVRDGRLRDSRRGFGRQGSWTPRDRVAGIGVPAGLRLDLDHVLVGDGIAVLDRRLGPDIGSDHLPVVATVTCR